MKRGRAVRAAVDRAQCAVYGHVTWFTDLDFVDGIPRTHNRCVRCGHTSKTVIRPWPAWWVRLAKPGRPR